MGDGGIGLARRDFNALIADRARGGAGAATTPSAAGTQATVAAALSGQGAAADSAPGSFYALRGVYFKREQFSSDADCLTAAHRQGLPLEMCR
jgi:hypothetical protein